MSAQTDTLFWFAAPYVTTGHCSGATCPGGQPILLRISTLNLAATVTISEPADTTFIPIILNIPANSTVSQDITSRRALIENIPVNTVNKHGLQIRSDNLVTAYYEVNQWYNPEIYALKGKNALGTEFYISSQNVWSNGGYTPTPYSSFEIVATEDNTIVTITPSKNIVGHTAGTTFTILLNKGQTYSATATSQTAANHLMGSHVTSDKPIAITISDDSVAKDGCRDLIGDQTIPVNIIGKEYIIMKGQMFTDERFFILAVQNNTAITINGVYVTTINAGQTYSEAFTTNTHVEATNPIYMYHVSGFQCELGSAILPPIDQCTGSTQVGFTRSIGQDFYLNIMVRVGAESGFILNGDGPNTIIPASAFSLVPGSTEWMAAQINFTAGTTIPVGAASLLSNTIDLFHMGIINGNSSVGCRYGYFSDFNVLHIGAIVAGTGSDVIKRCYGESAQLIATGGTHYVWSPAQDLDNPNIQSPIASPLTTTKYTVTVSGACNMTDSASITVYVAPPLNANFAIEHTNGCTPFTANIVNASYGVSDYNWSFGDGNNSIFSGTTFQHTYSNLTTSTDTFNLRLITTNIYDCIDTAERTIIVYPQVQANFNLSPIVGCHPLQVTYTNTSIAANYFTWTYGDGGSSNQADTSHTFYNYSSADTIYTTTLFATSEYGCNDTIQKNITVAPYLKAHFTVEYTTGCTPFSCQINQSSIGANSYEWDFGDGFTSTQAASTFNHAYTNTTSSPITFQIKLVVKNLHNCTDSLMLDITVYPAVDALFTAIPTEGCNELTVDFTNNSIGANQYFWLFGDGGSSAQLNPEHIFSNPATSDSTYQTSLVAISQYSCQDTATANIKVYSYLKADFTLNYNNGCTPFNGIIVNTSIGATSYSWDFGDDSLSNTNSINIQHLFINNSLLPITYQIRLIVFNSHNCTDTCIKNITIFPAVHSAFTITPNIGCNELSTNYINTSTGANSCEWIFGDGGSSTLLNPTHIFTNYNLTDTIFTSQLIAISSYGCQDTSTNSVTVYSKLQAVFTLNYTTGCTPFNCTINNSSIGASVYEWNFGDGTVSNLGNQTIQHLYINNTASSITDTIRLIVTNAHGCIDTLTRTTTIFPAVISSFAITPSPNCNHVTVNFTNNSSGAATYTWLYGDGGSSTDLNPIHFYENLHNYDTNYTAQLIAISTNGCNDTASANITVHPSLHANFSLQYSSACAPYTAIIQNNSTGADSFQWNFGNGNTSLSQGPIFNEIYTNATNAQINYNISLIVSNIAGCTDTLAKTITINPSIHAAFGITADTGCSPLSITFSNQSNGAISYEWDFADGTSSNDTNPTHTFQNFGITDTIYLINLIANSPWFCTDTAMIGITVHPEVTANFNLDKNAGCTPFTVLIHNTSQGIVDYYWDLGNGDTSTTNTQIINLTYTNSVDTLQIIPITLKANNSFGCRDSLTKEITIFPAIISAFTADTTSGCNPLTVTFTNNSPNTATAQWIFGDGGSSSSLQNNTHTFTNNQTQDTSYYPILITTSAYNCTDTSSTIITVFPYIKADFTTAYTFGCTPFNMNISNTSIGANTYNWNFGDGNISNSAFQNTNHTYYNYTNTPDTFLLSLTIQNADGCSDSTQKHIIVNPSVTSAFTTSPIIGCNPLTVNFQNTSAGATLYEWSYGDGGNSFFTDSSHVFNNISAHDTTYTISLITTSLYNCKDTTHASITVYANLKADFSFEYSSGCTPFDVEILNTSFGASAYHWDFGDGTTSVTSNTIIHHEYNNFTENSITQNIKLTIENPHHCMDSLQRDIAIFPSVTAFFTATPTSGCNPLTVNFTNFSTHATDINWDYGDGGSSATLNPTHTFTNLNPNDTIYHTQLIATSAYNCIDTATTDITVFSKINADFTLEYNTGCTPFIAVFNNHSTGATSYHWDFGNGDDSTTAATSLNYTYQNLSNISDTNNITLIVNNIFSCADTISHEVIVHPAIHADFAVSPDSGCSPLISDFQNLSTGATSYLWNFGDNGTSSQENPTHIYTNNTLQPIIYKPFLAAASAHNCIDTITKNIIVAGKINVDFTIENDNGCSPFNLQIHNNSSGISQYFWDFGDTTSATTSDTLFTHTFSNNTQTPVTYRIKLQGFNNMGCNDSIIRQITVFPNISAAFTQQPLQGCSPLIAAFTNQSSIATGLYWSFGDGFSSTAINPTHLFTNYQNSDTSFNILLVVTSEYLCKDTATGAIMITGSPTANFSIENTEGCSPFTSIVYNHSTNDNQFLWDFGDGTTSTTTDTIFTHQFENNTGNYIANELTLTVTNDLGCSSIISKTILVYPQLIAAFISDTAGCSPLSASFTNTSTNASDYLWSFNDGTTSNAIHPTHVFTNNSTIIINRTVTLTSFSTFGCSDTALAIIKIYPSPIAQFSVSPGNQTYPSATVSILNATLGTWNWLWTFGDGDSSSVQSPQQHTYQTWGSYTITLKVWDGYCTDTTNKTIQINSTPPISLFTTSANNGCPPLTITFTNGSHYGTQYYWNFGDGGTSSLENPTYTFYNAGTFEVQLATYGYGGQSTTIQTITVNPLPHAFFHVTPEVVTIPEESIQCYNQSNLASFWLWNFGDGQSSTEENPTYTYTHEGEYDISLITWSEKGCSDTFIIPKAVRAKSECQLLFPNAFTPSPSGSIGGYYNQPDHTFDVFHPLFRGVNDYQLEIFNRWGELIFVSKDVNIGWDGYYRGVLCKQDVYVWKAKWKCTDGSSQTKVGDVTLLR